MAYRHKIIGDNPSGAWTVTPEGVVQDFSGYGRDGSPTFTTGVFTDNFDRANANPVGAPWIASVGQWKIQDGAVRTHSGDWSARNEIIAPWPTKNARVSVLVNAPTSGYAAGPIVRRGSGTGYIYAYVDKYNSPHQFVIANSGHTLYAASGALTPEQDALTDYMITIESNGNLITATYADIVLTHTLSAGDDAAFTGTQVGYAEWQLPGGSQMLEFEASPLVVPSLLEYDTQIVAGSGNTLRLDKSKAIKLPLGQTIMAGPTRDPFSLEAWFKPVNVSERTTILGHTGSTDGLTYDGDKIRFKTDYLVSGSCEVSYSPPLDKKRFHVFGVHDETANYLFVDGKLVGVTFLTEEQLTDSYAPVLGQTSLNSGYSTNGSGVIMADGFAIYNRAIQDSVVSAHYLAGSQVSDWKAMTEAVEGQYWTIEDVNLPYLLNYSWIGDDALITGELTNLTVSNGVQADEDLAGLTKTATWRAAQPIIDGICDGSKIEWDSDGPVVVEVSTDGDVTWQACTNGSAIPGLPVGAVTLDSIVSVRVTFPAGEVPGNTVLRGLTLKVYQSRTLVNSNGTQSLQPIGEVSVASAETPILEQSESAGLKLNGGYITLTPVNVDDDNTEIKSLELWIRVDSLGATPQTLVDFRADRDDAQAYLRWNGTTLEATAADVYFSGHIVEPETSAIQDERWYHVVINPTVGTDNAIRIGANYDGLERMVGQIGHVAVHRLIPNDEDVAFMYNAYLDNVSRTFSADANVTVADAPDDPSVYAYEWSITSV